jgi:hypothetical protein
MAPGCSRTAGASYFLRGGDATPRDYQPLGLVGALDVDETA